MIRQAFLLSVGFVFLLFPQTPMKAADSGEMDDRIHEAVKILSKKQKSSKPIPAKILEQARAVAIIEIGRGGFGVGGSHGEGVILSKTAKGWSAPAAYDQGGGSVGFQIGFEEKQYIFLFNSTAALDEFIANDEVKFDAKASATAGPEHVNEDVSGPPPAIYVYTSSDGAFAGATIGGMGMSIQRDVNRAAYGRSVTTKEIFSGSVKPPESAKVLYELLNAKGRKPAQ
ncbi:MAG: lipid-binding SYLF domain-containing protein [Verrucomicrobiae bacterium]|nr:lipid-binding SYLF domain-containing protein [Verrucomicrobiae bacterium]